MAAFWKSLGHAALGGLVSGASVSVLGGVSGWKGILAASVAAALTGVASFLSKSPSQAAVPKP